MLFIVFTFPVPPTINNLNSLQEMEKYINELEQYTNSVKTSAYVLGIFALINFVIDYFFIKEITYDIPSLLNNSSTNKAIITLESNNKNLQTQLNALTKKVAILEHVVPKEITQSQEFVSKKREGKILQERK